MLNILNVFCFVTCKVFVALARLLGRGGTGTMCVFVFAQYWAKEDSEK